MVFFSTGDYQVHQLITLKWSNWIRRSRKNGVVICLLTENTCLMGKVADHGKVFFLLRYQDYSRNNLELFAIDQVKRKFSEI